MKRFSCNIRKTAWSAAILALPCVLSVALAGQQAPQEPTRPQATSPSGHSQGATCPMPNISDNRYSRKIKELAAQSVPVNDPRWVPPEVRFDNYHLCAIDIYLAAGQGHLAFVNSKQIKDNPNVVKSIERFKASVKRGYQDYPDLQWQTFLMAYHGASVEETTRSFFCKCLRQHLDDGLSAALGEEPDGD